MTTCYNRGVLELEPWDRAARGLREHVRRVAEALGCTGDAFLVQTESPVSVYLPLEQELDGHDAALLWTPGSGWAAAAETDGETYIISYLGAALPEPGEVAAFVADLAAGRPAGRVTPPTCQVTHSDLAALHRENRRSEALLGRELISSTAPNSPDPVNVPT
jgi:hypothetical protein